MAAIKPCRSFACRNRSARSRWLAVGSRKLYGLANHLGVLFGFAGPTIYIWLVNDNVPLSFTIWIDKSVECDAASHKPVHG